MRRSRGIIFWFSYFFGRFRSSLIWGVGGPRLSCFSYFGVVYDVLCMLSLCSLFPSLLPLAVDFCFLIGGVSAFSYLRGGGSWAVPLLSHKNAKRIKFYITIFNSFDGHGFDGFLFFCSVSGRSPAACRESGNKESLCGVQH